MQDYIFKLANDLSKYDCYYDVSRVNRIANTLAKKVTDRPSSKKIKDTKGKTFSQLLTESWKMSKDDMQDYDKVKDVFKRIFDTYHTWAVNAKKSGDKTYFEKGLKVFDNAIDKMMDKMTIPDEKGGAGWNKNNLITFMHEASNNSEYWKEGNSEGVNWRPVTRGLHH